MSVSPRSVPDCQKNFTRRCDELAFWGLDHVVVITSGPWKPEAVAVLGEAASLVAGPACLRGIVNGESAKAFFISC
ncbi:hypothetical protein [Amycolatopsis sp. NPDC049868]|uniref:hypothetical protein n=1 Tax=Amycolatopsis sp. NPDC049868 TaxID=3363934 RepID=UPI0037B67EF4